MPDVDYNRSIDKVSSVPDLWYTVKDYLKSRGVVRFSYHPTKPLNHLVDGLLPPPVLSWGFPDAWVQRYIAADFATIDPIPEYALRRGTAFWWTDVKALATLNEAQKAYLAELEEQNLGAGAAMAVYGPMLQNAYAGMVFMGEERSKTGAELTDYQSAVQIAHLRYCELIADTSPSFGVLSVRERQVLALVAVGKSNGVIAELLGLSRHTVDTLIRRIFDKFGVSDRTTAVVAGYAAGVIQIGERKL